MNTLLFFQSSALTWSNIALGAAILLSLGNAVIILRSRQREEAHAQTVRQAAIYKERMEYFEEESKKEKERADTFETGYKALAGLNIRELLDFNGIKIERDSYERLSRNLQDRLASSRVEGSDNVR